MRLSLDIGAPIPIGGLGERRLLPPAVLISEIFMKTIAHKADLFFPLYQAISLLDNPPSSALLDFADDLVGHLINTYQIIPNTITCKDKIIIISLKDNKSIRLTSVGCGAFCDDVCNSYSATFEYISERYVADLIATSMGRKTQPHVDDREKATSTYHVNPLKWGPKLLKVSGYMVEADTVFGSFKIRQKSKNEEVYTLTTPSLKYATSSIFESLDAAKVEAENIYITMLEDSILTKVV